ncbi:hypothetical protein [Pseudomonas sp. PDM25]|uniref:hypothetical protein n=1 Tax=Pseudomonas sp. PDM25 TaxID=2854772 RepID=UPI001C43713C|nr:hypothetical protein [Pseudomonas sp. PDM25]MBV7515848.1 hypothetical protein [Pseudomonas sp. PDM25]
MHTEAHFVLENVLIACKTINVFGDLAVKNLETGIPIDLMAEEKDELVRAFKLMRLTLDFVDPLITASFDHASRRCVV